MRKGRKKKINMEEEFSIGNWNYLESQKKIIWTGENPLGFEINMLKSCALKWLDQCSQVDGVSNGDMGHLVNLFNAIKSRTPWLPVFHNKVPKYIMRKLGVNA